MTQQEIQERNKEIALMLGKKYQNNKIVIHYNNICGVNPTGETWQECLYHSDWNWLMEAVGFIENLNVEYSVEIIRATCVIRHFSTIFSAQYFKKERDKKEAVFIAVSDFAKLYNNKEL
jgi:hypothetical protein